MGKKSFIYVKDNGHISIEAFACKMASYIFAEGALGTQYGGWSVSTSELEDYFSLEEGTIDSDFVEKITDAMQNNFGDMVEVESYEDEDVGVVFDLTYYHSFVPGFLEDDACIIENREDILEKDEISNLIEETSFEDLVRIFSKYCDWLTPISEFNDWLGELESKGTLLKYAILCQKHYGIDITEDNLGEKYKYFEKIDFPLLYGDNASLKEVIFRFFDNDLLDEQLKKFTFDLFYNLYGEEK